MLTTFDSLGLTVLERGWLSSNSTVIVDGDAGWVVDSGYASHAPQTVELVQQVLGIRKLVGILNTHLHSDHCGGNAALSSRFAGVQTWIPPGQADAVRRWDVNALTYQPTGQQCDQFSFDGLLQPGDEVRLGPARWEVHAAPGHDPHAVLLFQRQHRVLISGDALWENGFGVVFPELEGLDAFHEVANTLDLIQSLAPTVVIPGHGRPFENVPAALDRAHKRLDQFLAAPHRHAEYAAKVLVKFHLLDRQRLRQTDLEEWYRSTPYFALVSQHRPDLDLTLPHLLDKLVSSSAAEIQGEWVIDR
ncbi:MBL fold metallo-hydrolase [Hydrogenophaga sp. IBVHS2]|uniref:MBL fold metallo-hydrolase n=1 Tax=Hydrogenophaga sp. IBVHS2 TaxID=1985170 RepID=UPI000A2E2F3C|nr:MBL fold metallo-hydrolase [Hydrogenophaga sp. IBVHS2]OSZ63873.1 MBL fold metallo-hydrolase [Hydrogenophaga sp. IBVHS2]